MNITGSNYSGNINFGAKISDGVLVRVQRQKKGLGNFRNISRIFEKQMQEIPKWGSPDAQVVITKNKYGKYCLGVRTKVRENTYLSWAMERLKGKTELSQFLNMTSTHICDTEHTILYMFQKYGLKPFIDCMK